jgi:hypothetical protein
MRCFAFTHTVNLNLHCVEILCLVYGNCREKTERIGFATSVLRVF